jgi:hypothetical protein
MSGRPAAVRARDVKQIIIGAKRAGATRAVITIGKATITVPLDGEAAASPDAPEADEQITL